MAEFTRDYSEMNQVNVFFNENDMICGICRCSWITRHPRCLPCDTTHIFCSKCLDRLIEANLIHGFIICPICRREYTLTEKGLKAFPLLSPFVNSSFSPGSDRNPLFISQYEICDFNLPEKIPSIREDYFFRKEPFERSNRQTKTTFLRFETRVNDIFCLNGIPYCLTEHRHNGKFKYYIVKLLNDNRVAERVAEWTSNSTCHRFALNSDVYLLTGIGSNRRVKRLKLKDEDRSDMDDKDSLELRGIETVCPRVTYLMGYLDGFVLVHDNYLEYYSVRPLRLKRRVPLPSVREVADMRAAGATLFVLFGRGQLFSIDLNNPQSNFQLSIYQNPPEAESLYNEVFDTVKQGRVILCNSDLVFIICIKTKHVHCLPYTPVLGHFKLKDYFVTDKEIVFYMTAFDGLVAVRYYNFK